MTAHKPHFSPEAKMQRAIRRLLLITIVVGGSILWRQQSLAAIIVEQPWTGNINGEDSLVIGQQVAEYFEMPTTSLIKSLGWYGVGTDGDLDHINTEAFQIRFYADTPIPPGQPETLDHSPALFPFYTSNVVATLQYTGHSIFVPPEHELALFSFAANLTSPILLTTGVTYCVHAKYKCQWISNLELSVARRLGSGGG
jgi:hypothetical protein